MNRKESTLNLKEHLDEAWGHFWENDLEKSFKDGHRVCETKGSICSGS